MNINIIVIISIIVEVVVSGIASIIVGISSQAPSETHFGRPHRARYEHNGFRRCHANGCGEYSSLAGETAAAPAACFFTKPASAARLCCSKLVL